MNYVSVSFCLVKCMIRLGFSKQVLDFLMYRNDPKTGAVLLGSTLLAIPSVRFEGILLQHNLFVKFFKVNTTAWCLNLYKFYSRSYFCLLTGQ